MNKAIVGFAQDEAGHWVAQLACGHTQHVRHQPPWQNRAWVLSEQQRGERIGSELDCRSCDMAALPQGLIAYKQTPSFDERSVPAALLADHRTKPDVWAQIVVEEGLLEYTCARGTFVLRPGVVGVVEPASPHRVRPLKAMRFHVVFLRAHVPTTPA
jgi:tellurite methyltransferase